MLAKEAEFVAIDFESTGSVPGYEVQPWQIGLVFITGGAVVSDCRFTSLLHVGDRPFNPYAPGRHASLRDELAQAPRLTDLWQTLRNWLVGRPLVAHNTSTERKLLGEAFPLHSPGPWIDTLDLARAAYPQLASHALEDLVGRLGLMTRVAAICPNLGPHDALYDAVACGVLLEHVLSLPTWCTASVDDLVSCKPNRRSAEYGDDR